MIIKEGRFSTGTGNRLCENITYEIHRCDECKGEGYLEMYLEEMIDYLKQYYDGWDFRGFRAFVRKNIKKRSGKIYVVVCQNCLGAKEWEVWY